MDTLNNLVSHPKQKQEFDELSRLAFEYFTAGDFGQAIQLRIKLYNARKANPEYSDFLITASYIHSAGDTKSAVLILEQGLNHFPDHITIREHLGFFQMKLNRFEEAEKNLNWVITRKPDQINTYDALAQLYGLMEREKERRKYGLTALQLKEAQVAGLPSMRELSRVPIPPMVLNQPERNVISFSLWGNKQRYLKGALENVLAARFLYPGWRCRFYCGEDVSKDFRTDLLADGADLILMPGPQNIYEGLFWRFYVADDPNIDRYLVRDSDSVLSVRERAAVSEWLESKTHFHIMRDAYTHTELILAGLWGGVRGALPPLGQQLKQFLKSQEAGRTIDQIFLRKHVWPTARDSCLVHDSMHGPQVGCPFPSSSRLPRQQHVGENLFYNLSQRSKGRLKPARSDLIDYAERKHYVFSVSPGRCGTQFLSTFLKENLKDAEVHHERVGPGNMGRHSPDSFHLTEFNTHGNVAEVRDFWHRKLIGEQYGTRSTYVELSHFLCKGGLVENLNMLPDSVTVDLLFIHRDIFDLTLSFANRFDFANRGFTWLFALDPSYRNVIIPSEKYQDGTMISSCFWYVLEMKARMAYYSRLLEGRKNIKSHELQFKDVVTESGATSLLDRLKIPGKKGGKTPFPGKLNKTRSHICGTQEHEAIRLLVNTLDFDPAKLGLKYFESGCRLANGPVN